jgi:hypothetical protein
MAEVAYPLIGIVDTNAIAAAIQAEKGWGTPPVVEIRGEMLVVTHASQAFSDSSVLDAAFKDLLPIPPPGGGVAAPWKGVIAAAHGDGNPENLLRGLYGGPISPTPTNIGITVARVSYFFLDTALTVNRIRWFGAGATTNVFRVALYRDSDSVRLTSELPITTALNVWGSVLVSPSVSLAANTLYFLGVSVNSVGTTAGPAAGVGAGRIAVLPNAWPGSLDSDALKVAVGHSQFAVTAGGLITPAPARTAQAAWTGGMPAFFLDSNAAA